MVVVNVVVRVVSQLLHRVVAAVVIIVADCIAVSPLPVIASHRCRCRRHVAMALAIGVTLLSSSLC